MTALSHGWSTEQACKVYTIMLLESLRVANLELALHSISQCPVSPLPITSFTILISLRILVPADGKIAAKTAEIQKACTPLNMKYFLNIYIL